ncbi:hypothetical protein MP228_007085 [Amoeboaphelidium protococcarum]|nr:hypothetical protein MP228_007085 [Amoeboaphelidium protococcarum]
MVAPSALHNIKLLELLLAFEIRGTTEDVLYLAYTVKYEFFSHLLYLNSFCHVPLQLDLAAIDHAASDIDQFIQWAMVPEIAVYLFQFWNARLHVYDCNDVLDIIRGMDYEFYQTGVHLVDFVKRTIDPDELNVVASNLGLPKLDI